MKDKQKKFSQIILSKNYIFHIHTNYTDGHSSIEEYCRYFQNKEILIFTEHIRKKPTYDWKEFLNKARNLGCLAGFEAKILPSGNLDIPESALFESDLIAVAVHSFNGNVNDIVFSLRKAFDKYWKLPIVWVHPASSPAERVHNKISYIEEVLENHKETVYIEYNLKRKNLSKHEIWYLLRNSYKLIKGYDAHSLDELLKLRRENHGVLI